MKDAQLSKIEVENSLGEKFLTITQGRHYTYAKWSGHIIPDDVIRAAETFLEYIKEHPCPKLINDKSEATGDWQDVNDWLEYEWMPAAYTAGLRCMAHIYSYSMFSQLAAIDLHDRIDPPLFMKNFIDFESAEEWILKCSALPETQTDNPL